MPPKKQRLGNNPLEWIKPTKGENEKSLYKNKKEQISGETNVPTQPSGNSALTDIHMQVPVQGEDIVKLPAVYHGKSSGSTRPYYLIPLSAKSEEALRRKIKDLYDWLMDDGKDASIGDIAYTLLIGRSHFSIRSALIVSDNLELKQNLTKVLEEGNAVSYISGRSRPGKADAMLREQGKRLISELCSDHALNGIAYREKLQALAEMYINGYDMDWEELYREETYKRISLPAYPFSGERYWISGDDALHGITNESTSTGRCEYKTLHPLIDRNESTLEEECFVKTFNGQEFYLKDHRVGNDMILPGVVYLEMARAAGSLASNGLKVAAFRDVVWAWPIKMSKSDMGRRVKISLYPGDGHVEYLMSGEGADGERLIHGHGSIIYTGNEDAFDGVEHFNIDEIKRRCPGRVTGEECYRTFREGGLDLGKSFHCIRELFMNNKEVIGKIQLPEEHKETLKDLELHPSLMDGALEVVIGLVAGVDPHERKLSLPVSIDEVRLLAPLEQSCYSYATLSEKTGENGESKYDVYILDEDGRVLVFFKGFMLKELSLQPGTQNTSIKKMYYRTEWEKADPVAGGVSEAQGSIVVFDTGKEIFDKLKAMNSNESDIVLVRPGKSYREKGNNVYEVNPVRREDFIELVQAFREKGIFPGRIIFLWSGECAFDKENQVAEQLERSVYSLLYFFTELMKQKEERKIQLIYAYHAGEGELWPIHAAISAFARTVCQENSKFMCKTLRLEGLKENMLTLIMQEFGGEGCEDVRYVNGTRFVRRLKEFEIAVGNERQPRYKGVYLITGGLGGLGLIFAEHLAQTSKARLVLTDLVEPDADRKNKIKALETMGAEVLYIKADISRKQEVESLVQAAKQKFGCLNGIIHTAGVTRDSYIVKKTKEEMDKVLAPKVYGTLYLDAASRNEELDFFVTFSSIAAVMGNAGQCDYAYANSFMDYFAQVRGTLVDKGERKGKTLSVNWSLWKDGGMKVDEQTSLLFTNTMGITPLRKETGLEAFNSGLAMDETGFMVLEGVPAKVRRTLGITVQEVKRQAPAAENFGKLLEKIQGGLKEIVSKLLKVKEKDIQLEVEMSEYGFNSLTLTDFANRINKSYKLTITPALFFECPTLGSLAEYLYNVHGDVFADIYGDSPAKAEIVNEDWDGQEIKVSLDEFNIKSRFPVKPSGKVLLGTGVKAEPEPVAIIGISGIMPGSDNLEEFWENIENGQDLITEIPKDRWDWRALDASQGRSISRWGGFMNEVDKFDSMFFKLSPREAQRMDPQQRLFLETVWKTVEDAGYRASDLYGTRTGLFVGVATNDYYDLTKDYGLEIESYSSMGVSHCILANRISYIMNWHGPSVPIDTACSSSLIAVHQALESIKNGDCDMAVAGGINVIASPTLHISFSKAGMLSPDGRCKTFDKRANGYVRGEGSGAILLKPLSKAEADGDHIYAVIKGSAVNHGGHANSLTAPNPKAQAELLIQAYERAGIDPSTVSYIEAHGTGTNLGDPVEINGLKIAFKELYKRSGKEFPERPHCGLSSVKTNIGHLEAAAGIAGVLKVLLCMKYEKLTGNIQLEEVNPFIELSGTPFYVVDKGGKWERLKDETGREVPRRAGISSFGFGGANAHVIVEEYNRQENRKTAENREKQIIVLSAKNKDRLKAYAKSLVEFFCKGNVPQQQTEVGSTESMKHLRDEISEAVLEAAAGIINVDSAEIDDCESLEQYNFDGVSFAKLAAVTAERYGIDINPAVFSEYPSVSAFSQYVLGQYEESIRQNMREPGQGEEKRYTLKGATLEEIAYTLQVGREPMEERLALIAADIEELVDKLSQYCEGNSEIDNLYTGNKDANQVLSGLLTEGRAGKEFLKILISERDLDKIAQLWTSGLEIDWRQLYSSYLPKRISLPTYPFARERHWLPEEQKTQITVSAALHPLVDGIDAASSLGEGVVFRKALKADYPLVKDHVVHGRPILPGVGYLEMAYWAAAQIGDADNCVLSGVTWLQPLVVADGRKNIRIVIKNDGNGLEYQVQSMNGDTAVLHSNGEIRFDGLNGKSVQKINVEEIKSRCSYRLEKKKIYEGYESCGIKYGPYLRRLETVYGNNREALGRISLAEPYVNELKEYKLHPAIMDAALQTIGILAMNEDMDNARSALPYAVERVEVLKPLKKAMYAYVKAAGSGCFNVAITDENGIVCVKLYQVVVKKQAIKPEVRKEFPEDFLYLPIWKREPLPAGGEPLADEAGRKVLLVYTPTGAEVAKTLSKELKQSDVTEIILGNKNVRRRGKALEVKADEPEALDSCLEGMEQIDCIYFLGGIETGNNDMDNLEMLAERQERGVISLFRLVKALDRRGFKNKLLVLKVVGNDACCISEDAPVRPAAAAVYGMAKSIAREYSSWKVSCIDISLDEEQWKTDSRVKAILDEPVCINGEEAVIRGGERYVRSFCPMDSNSVEQVPFRYNGVYMIAGGAGGIGLELGRYLADTVKARLVLLGRSTLNDLQKEKIALIEANGGEVLYIQADITDDTSMQAAVKTAVERFGEINGVIHSAIVLKDMLLENMDEDSLRSVLDPKVKGSVVLHKALRGQKLDFIMFFSSIQSFIGNAGQANYAAACAFKDAYAHYLGRCEDYPVRIVNWGFWGSVGVVATREYNLRMEALGMMSVNPDEGMEAVRRILAGSQTQVMAIKADRRLLEGMRTDMKVRARFNQQKMPSILEPSAMDAGQPVMCSETSDNFNEALKRFERLQEYMLLAAIQRMGVFKTGGEQYGIDELKVKLGIIPQYWRLYRALIDILAKAGFVEIRDGSIVTTHELDTGTLKASLDNLEVQKQALVSEYPEIKAHASLLPTCIDKYPEILKGDISATSVMFPNSSMELVEGIYKGNAKVDYFNELVVWSLQSYIRARLPQLGQEEKIKILEVGAGTGGTSKAVLEGIRTYGDRLQYVYTDISVGFIQFGRRMFEQENPFVVFKTLNVEGNIEEQGYIPGEFDIIIAANVLHATKSIEQTLHNIKTLLKTNGWLVVNELTDAVDFVTLTFGLLEGWWLYEDEEKRIKGSPLLSTGMWRKVLAEQGFRRVTLLGRDDNGQNALGQNVIIAESNGVIINKAASRPNEVNQANRAPAAVFRKSAGPAQSLPVRTPEVQVVPKAPAVKNSKQEGLKPVDGKRKTLNREELRQQVEQKIIENLVKTLGIDVTTINLEKQFSEYGVDSITGLELIKNINEVFGIVLRTIVLFDYGNVKDLSRYIVSEYEDRISEVLDFKQTELASEGVDSIVYEDEADILEAEDEADDELILLEKLASGEISEKDAYELMEVQDE